MRMPGGYEYHSATHGKDGAVAAPEMQRWRGFRGVALVHDIGADPNLPREFDEADVLYAEPPFRPGYEKFHERAGVQPALSYPAFIAVCSQVIAKKRGVLILGRHAERYAVAPTYSHLSHLHKKDWEVLAYWYGIRPPRDFDNVIDIIAWLSTQYDCVGDFCAGYGYTGQAFAVAGKRFVLSDVVPSCIGYIAEHADGWCTSNG